MAGAITMTGKLDEISEAIGGLRARFDSLSGDIIDNRRIADDRHMENKTRLDKIEATLSSLASDRRVAVIIISMITGGIMWAVAHIAPGLMSYFKK